MKKYVKTIRRRQQSGGSWYGNTRSYSFRYNEIFNKESNIASYLETQKIKINWYQDNREGITFIENKKWGKILLRKFSRDDCDIVIETWFILCDWKFYIATEIEEIEKSDNGTWGFFSADRWETTYELSLEPIYLEELNKPIKSFRKSFKGDWFVLDYDEKTWKYIKTNK